MAYYDISKTLTYHSLLNFLLGGRNIGKSYNVKLYLLEKALKTTKGYFIYIRRRKVELNLIDELLGDIVDKFPDHEIKQHKTSNGILDIYVNGVLRIKSFALSSSAALRSSGDYTHAIAMLFDEFLPDDQSYLRDEVNSFLSLYHTILRQKKYFPVYFLGNSHARYNPYFDFFNFYPPRNDKEFKVKTDPEEGNVILIEMSQLKEDKNKTSGKFSALIRDTEYGAMAQNNEFIDENLDNIATRPKDSYELVTVALNNKKYGIWQKEDELYFSRKTSGNKIFALDSDDLRYPYLYKSERYGKLVDEKRFAGKIFFDNQGIREAIKPWL